MRKSHKPRLRNALRVFLGTLSNPDFVGQGRRHGVDGDKACGLGRHPRGVMTEDVRGASPREKPDLWPPRPPRGWWRRMGRKGRARSRTPFPRRGLGPRLVSFPSWTSRVRIPSPAPRLCLPGRDSSGLSAPPTRACDSLLEAFFTCACVFVRPGLLRERRLRRDYLWLSPGPGWHSCFVALIALLTNCSRSVPKLQCSTTDPGNDGCLVTEPSRAPRDAAPGPSTELG